MSVPPILEVVDLHASYGPFGALFGVDIELRPRRTLALLGKNGAGKSTVARCVSGLVRCAQGKVLYEGRDITRETTVARRQAGICYIPEGRPLFGNLTVEENLRLFLAGAGERQVGPALERVYEFFPRFRARRKQLAGTLSGGEQRILALVVPLVRPPRVLIVDELSFGLAPVMAEAVYEELDRLRAEGITLVIIEQDVRRALVRADEFVVLERGQVVMSGPCSEADQEAITRLIAAG